MIPYLSTLLRDFRRVPILAGLLLVSVAAAGCVQIPPGLFGSGRGPVEKEVLIPADSPFVPWQVLVVDLVGIVNVESDSGWFGGDHGMLVELKDRLLAAEKDRRIRALVLRIDSPGGGVTASDLVHREIRDFKKRMEEKRGRPFPVVAFMQDVAASGGLYAAMAADEILALPTTLTGSVGVITVLPNLEGLGEKIGVSVEVVKSGSSKDAGSPWRALTDEERANFQETIDAMYERFVAKILDARAPKGLTRESLAPWADGRVFDGGKAAEIGLIDGTAYPDEVFARAIELAGLRDAAIVGYVYPYGYRGNVYATARAGGGTGIRAGSDVRIFSPEIGLPALGQGPRFLYLWNP